MAKLTSIGTTSRRLRVLFVQPRFYPAVGGSETHVHLLAKELVRQGHDVTVYTTTSLAKDDLPSFRGRKTGGSVPVAPEESIDGIRVRRFPIRVGYRAFLHSPALANELRAHASEYDVIHGHCYNVFTTFVACRAARKAERPFVLTAHDLGAPTGLPFVPRALKQAYDKTFGRYILRESSRLIALTEAQRDEYASMGAQLSRTRVIPNAIELAEYEIGEDEARASIESEFGIPHDAPLLSFVGRIEEYKGIQDAIEALPQVLTLTPSARLMVVGRDEGHRATLERLAESLKVRHAVVFTGLVSNRTKVAILRRSNLFVFPSRLEGFGIVLAEAMAVGTLCIGYPIPAVRDVLLNGDAGVLVSSKDALATQVCEILAHPEKWERQRATAMFHARSLALPAVAEKLVRVYVEVVA